MHNSNPDVRSGMYCREPAKKISDLFGFEALPERGGGRKGEGDNGLRNSEWSPPPACTRWDSEKTEIRSRGFGRQYLCTQSVEKRKFEAEASDSNSTHSECVRTHL